MKMVAFLFLNFFSFSFQAVDVVFFVNYQINEIYLVANGVRKWIAGAVPSTSSYVFPVYNLNADPGDLIELKTDNDNGGVVHGAGCFLMDNKCICSLFKNDDFDYTISGSTFHYDFPSITCGMTVKCLSQRGVKTNYYYKENVPLLASTIKCKGGSFIYLYGEKYTLKLLDYISANFVLKNLKVSITENYEYFTLNNNKLNADNEFHISSELTFSSTVSKKFNIKFINKGIRDSDRECSLDIRVCHQRCAKCFDQDIDEKNNEYHQCEICKSGFYPVEGNNNCMTKDEMKDKNYYFDEEEQKFKKCYKSCATCNAKSFDYEHNCTACENSYHYIYNETRKKNCIHENEKPINTFLDSETNTYELCNERCHSCSQKSDIINNNCDECKKDDNKNYIYHFVYNEPGQCINENEKPSDTYLDLDDNTYKKCYYRCSSCDIKGDESNNNCNECLKDKNGNYIYHFLHDEKGKCISEDEKPENTYLDLETNTYELCYEKCSSCDKKGDITDNNCKECLKDESGNFIYHLIYDKKGKCVNEMERPINSYLDKEDNTFKLCYERCSLCNKKGDKNNNNCNECIKDSNNTYLYHFLYNETGRCLNETEKPSDTYLDLKDNTYKKCYDRCSSCDKKGDDSNNNCIDCLKDENNTYLFHFLYNETGRCINEDEKPSNTYLDLEDNTYKLCYERCSSCNKKGDKEKNNCEECLKDINNTYLYHFVYNLEGKCINENEKPSNTYLDLESNTYKACYERCSTCNKKGNQSSNNCEDCLKDKNNNYLYHFIYNEEGKCLSDDERPSKTYLDTATNTYRQCYEKCNRCENFPECKECLKDGSNNYIYHFIYGEKGKCIDESEIKDGYYYLDSSDNTYKTCPEGTIKVENNECIENNTETILLVFIIILIIILIIVPLFFIWKVFFQNRKRNKDMKELIIS